jgi:alpha-D-ribose 1-methylphosphonate 5-triphosphate synthase subunit PhnH
MFVDPTDSPTTAATLAVLDDDVDDATNSPTTAVVLSVLDHDTGKFLEHRQLCCDSKHKST